jgi:hypothetical protein
VVWNGAIQYSVALAELLRTNVIEGYTDTLESAVAAIQATLATIQGLVDQVEGYTDTLESAVAAIQATLVSPFTQFTVTDASPLAGSFKGDAGLSATDDRYNQRWLAFISGALKGEARKVSDYVGSTKTFSFAGVAGALDAPFPAAPANGDIGILIGRSL